MVAGMDDRVWPRESEDPWRGRQPKYEKLVMRGPRRFALTTRLPTGESIDVPLGRLTFEIRVDPPPPR
jgi:hypothetical protein